MTTDFDEISQRQGVLQRRAATHMATVENRGNVREAVWIWPRIVLYCSCVHDSRPRRTIVQGGLLPPARPFPPSPQSKIQNRKSKIPLPPPRTGELCRQKSHSATKLGATKLQKPAIFDIPTR
jgi:hypothetical protein